MGKNKKKFRRRITYLLHEITMAYVVLGDRYADTLSNCVRKPLCSWAAVHFKANCFQNIFYASIWNDYFIKYVWTSHVPKMLDVYNLSKLCQ